MNRPLSALASTTIMLATLVIAPALPSSASLPPDPTVLTMPAFTISNGQLAVSPIGVWEQGSTTTYSAIVNQAYACTGTGSATSRQYTSNRSQVLSMESCSPLWANAGSSTPFSSGDLSGAFLNGVSYSGSPANIRIATIAVLTNGQFFSAATASQSYTPPPPTPGPTSPTWNSGLVNGGVPQLSISGTIATVVSNPGPVRTGGLSIGFARIYACNQPVTAGFYSWNAPVGQPIFPPAGAVGGANCVEIGTGNTNSTLDLNSPGTNANANGATRYNPQTHGVHITVGWRDTDNFKTPSPANQDDLMWLSLGSSTQYIPPASPTAVLPVFTFVNDSITFSTQPSWTGEDANSEEYFVFACPGIVNQVSSPATSSAFMGTINGCRGLFTSASTLGSLVPATSLTNAQALVSGSLVPYNSSAHGRNIAIQSAAKYGTTPYRVTTASQNWTGSIGGGSPAQVVTPYTGPIVQAPGAVKPVASGSKLVLDGSNLTGVSKVTIDGKDASGKLNSEGKLEITIPKGLASGTYDLVITSDSGLLTVQDAIRVSGSSVTGEEPTPSTRLKEDNTVKVYVFNVVGAGKVQIMHNGKEVAWINTDDPDDAKILNDYLVRTLELVDGKNVIEIWVDGKRVDRKAYTKKTDVDLRA